MSSREGWLRARAEWYTFRPPQGLHRGATPDVPRVQKGLILRTYADGHAVCIDRVRATIPDVDATWFTVGARQLGSGHLIHPIAHPMGYSRRQQTSEWPSNAADLRIGSLSSAIPGQNEKSRAI